MKVNVLLLLLMSVNGFAQFGSQQIISALADGTQNIFIADLDGDGKKDVISANLFGDTISWNRKLDDVGNFAPQEILIDIDDPKYAVAADIDNDGDLDIVAISVLTNVAVWFENLDGNATFGLERIISMPVETSRPIVVRSWDVDADGNMDVIVTSLDNVSLSWYPNDGFGNFGTQQLIASVNGTNARDFFPADIDDDGDLDIVSASSGNAYASWFENIDGFGNFGNPNIIGASVEPQASLSVFAIDIDGDLDLDVITTQAGDIGVAWFENIDGLGTFDLINPMTAGGIVDSSFYSVYSADFDNDGDADVLATFAEAFTGEVMWFENENGLGVFSEKKIISTEVMLPRRVITEDLDNDGDIDVLSASQNDDKIAWYENFTILGLQEITNNNFQIYPNPTKDVVNISVDEGIITKICVYDIFGKLLFEEVDEFESLDVSKFSNGVLFVKIESSKGAEIKKLIKY